MRRNHAIKAINYIFLSIWIVVMSLAVLPDIAPTGQVPWMVISIWVFVVTIKSGLNHFNEMRENHDPEEGKS